MSTTISIILYPFFGGWRAECKECGAYANSGDGKRISKIGEALENLAKNPITFSKKSNTCQHQYGLYRPRVTCYVDYTNLKHVTDCVFNTRGCDKFPAILLDNKYIVSVTNANNVAYEWSAYSYVRHSQLTEEKEEQLAAEQALQTALLNASNALDESVSKHIPFPETSIWASPIKYILLLILFVWLAMVSLFVAAVCGVPEAERFLIKANEGCAEAVCPD